MAEPPSHTPRADATPRPPASDITASLPAADEPIVQRLYKMLKLAHDRQATAPIGPPDEHGAFPMAPFFGRWLGAGVPPIVADANRLRDDVLYACRHGRRTVLVTAANSGAMRIYCASHVPEEVDEHAREWTSEAGDVSHDDFMKRWAGEYMPLIRELRDADIPLNLLDPAEAQRIATLAARDPDDVPSGTLALLLGAYYFTEDVRALEAVYGADFDIEGHRAWLELLKAGGDAAELSTMLASFALPPTAAGAGLFYLARWLASTFTPWALVPAALGAWWLGSQVSPETRRKLQSGLGEVAAALGYISIHHDAVSDRFLAAAPDVPGWPTLAQTNDPRLVLARSCIYTLARSPDGHLSASELSQRLPHTSVGQGEQLVREVVRSYGCFEEPYKGRWQLGHAAQGAT